MKSFILFLLGIIIAGVIIYNVPVYRQKITQILAYSQCDSPTVYRVGSVDQRFDLSNNEVLNDIRQATDLWSTAEGKNLFVYSANADLTVNFVYDQRQALDTTISRLNATLDKNNATLQQQITDYQAQVASFQQRLDAFKNTVDRYNRQGGAPPSVYNDLITQQNQLKAQGDALNNQARQFNLSTNNYNEGISTLNQDINQFNGVLAQKPEEGLYDGNKNTITIYFANNKEELVHTLAHEFGHSLGINHVVDPLAIMYPYATKSLRITNNDIGQLNYVCREQPVIIHWTDEFYGWLDKNLLYFLIKTKQF